MQAGYWGSCRMNSDRQYSIDIEGMHCASCAARVEKALLSVAGIASARVNPTNDTAIISGNADSLELNLSLQQAGFPARQQTLQLQIQGMHCASCVARIEQTLKAQTGVLDARVNLAAESASIDYLSGMNSMHSLIQSVQALGFSANSRSAEPQQRSSHQQDERNQLRRQSLIAAGLTLPLFVMEMGSHMFPAFHHWLGSVISQQNSWLLQCLLCSLVMAGPGQRFYRLGIPALFRGSPDMNTLVAIGSLAAWGYSLVATFLPALLPVDSRAVYYESAAVIVTLILIGRYLEARARGRAGEAIRSLMGLQPRQARVERQGSVQELAIDQIELDDRVHVRPGERLPADGWVCEGHGQVDESMISGEPMPVAKAPGDRLTGGTINGTGALVMQVSGVGDQTMLAQIIRMVEQAQGARLPVQDLVNRITAWFVPAVLLIAVLTLLIWLLLGPDPVLTHALIAAVSVLIIACPCAMGLAVPTSIMVASGRAAHLGVLFRRGDALQRLQAISTIAIDKTGTLTEGRPTLTDLRPLDDRFDEDELLLMLAAVESGSEHAIGQAIVRAVRERQPAQTLALPEIEDFRSLTGRGVSGSVNGHRVLIGSARLMQEQGIDVTAQISELQALGEQGRTALLMAVDDQAAALLAVADPIRAETPAALEQLRQMGLELVMISGDSQSTANSVAHQLQIEHVVADVLPEGKVEAIRDLSDKGQKVAFVGDGINDAPALAAADVGIAIGSGTDVAIESADVVLMSADLHGVVNAIRISQKTLANIRQNLIWAFGYNMALIPVAMGLLYPFFGLTLSPMLAALAMALSSVFVLSNALRLRWFRAQRGTVTT